MAEQRQEKLGELLSNALDALSNLDGEARALGSENVDRLARVLDYGRTVVRSSDLALISDRTFAQLVSGLTSIGEQSAQNPTAFVQSQIPSPIEDLSDAFNSLPAGTHLKEQEIAGLVADTRERLEQEIQQLRTELQETNEQEASLKVLISAKESELTEFVDQKRAEANTQLQDLSAKIDNEATRIEEARTAHETQFRDAQGKQESKAESALNEFEEKAEATLSSTNEQTQAALEEALKAQEEAKAAQGAWGLAGTSARYSDEADKQGKAANWWRFGTVVFGLLAVGAGIWAASSHTEDGSVDESLIIGRLAIGLVLGGLAVYSANQSSRHRNREEDTREIALDLAAFSSFIEPLDDAAKAEERKALVNRVFGQQIAARNRGGNPDPGPSFANQLAEQIREALQRGEAAPPA